MPLCLWHIDRDFFLLLWMINFEEKMPVPESSNSQQEVLEHSSEEASLSNKTVACDGSYCFGLSKQLLTVKHAI